MSELMMNRTYAARPTAGRAGAHGLAAWLRMTMRAYVTREALLDLTPRERADIGVSTFGVAAEAARLPWDFGPLFGGRRPAGFIGAIQGAFERARTRRLLCQLSARELRDIGVSTSEAHREAARFFWQI